MKPIVNPPLRRPLPPFLFLLLLLLLALPLLLKRNQQFLLLPLDPFLLPTLLKRFQFSRRRQVPFREEGLRKRFERLHLRQGRLESGSQDCTEGVIRRSEGVELEDLRWVVSRSFVSSLELLEKEARHNEELTILNPWNRVKLSANAPTTIPSCPGASFSTLRTVASGNESLQDLLST